MRTVTCDAATVARQKSNTGNVGGHVEKGIPQVVDIGGCIAAVSNCRGCAQGLLEIIGPAGVPLGGGMTERNFTGDDGRALPAKPGNADTAGFKRTVRAIDARHGVKEMFEPYLACAVGHGDIESVIGAGQHNVINENGCVAAVTGGAATAAI